MTFPPRIQTFTGGSFDLLDPRADDVCIYDIAHALSQICRFTGHSRKFYSVAQHSVLVSEMLYGELRLVGLLHDASEAYMNDLATQLKHSPDLVGYRRLEKDVQNAIFKHFAVPIDLRVVNMPPDIKAVDRTMCLTEARDFMDLSAPIWKPYLEAWGEPFKDLHIQAWSPAKARHLFIQRFYKLTHKGA